MNRPRTVLEREKKKRKKKKKKKHTKMTKSLWMKMTKLIGMTIPIRGSKS